MSATNQMSHDIVRALLAEDDDDEALAKEVSVPSTDELDIQMARLLPDVVRAKEIYLGKGCVKTVQHTNRQGETYIFGQFGHRNSVMSTLLYLDPSRGWVPADPGFAYAGIKEEAAGEEDEFKEVYGGPEEKKYLPLGSISSGTMREEDLIPAFLTYLESVDPERAAELRAEFEEMPEDEYPDFCWETLANALEQHTPPYTYFGSNPGDGADYGVWVSTDSLDDDLKYQDTDKLRVIRKGEPLIPGSGYVVVIDDAGDYTALLDGRMGRPIWNI